jgi:hypothetical protein
MIELRPATMEDVAYVAYHLREADRIELALAQPDPPDVAVIEGIAYSEWTSVFCVNGVPAVVYGVSKTGIDGCGSPWMVATDQIKSVSRGFLRASIAEVDRMQRGFGLLVNQVHRANDISIAWLKWLGFTVETEPAGPMNEFYNFWRRA